MRSLSLTLTEYFFTLDPVLVTTVMCSSTSMKTALTDTLRHFNPYVYSREIGNEDIKKQK